MEQPTEPTNLPRILCLHGGGTSALIFQIQLRRLIWALRQHFTCVFVDAPLKSGPGPDVLPVFADFGPYYRWATLESPNEESVQLEVRELLKETIQKDGGDFVGVLGFSQGARMAAGLLSDQERGDSEGMPDWKFGVLLCGSHPPYSLRACRAPLDGLEDKAGDDQYGPIATPGAEDMISVPSVHMRGLRDKHLERGRRLARHFSDKMEFEFDQGHHLPGSAGDTTSPKTATADLAEAILQQYNAATKHQTVP